MLGRRVIGRLSAQHQIISAGRKGNPDVQMDLKDENPLLAPGVTCDVLIHCAASFENDTVAGAYANERVNALGAFHAATLAEHFHCKHMVYISTIFAYQNEDNQYNGSYGISKAHGEDNLALCCRILKIGYTCLRVSQIYDEQGESRRHQPFFYHIIDKAMRGEDILFYGTKDRLRNYIFVEDVVSVIERIISSGIVGTYPLIFPRSYTLREIAETAYKVFQKPGRIAFLREKPDIPGVFIPPVSDLEAKIAFTPQTDLDKGMSLIRDYLFTAT